MDLINKLARGVAHEFNNYLTSILGYSEMLLTSIPAGTDDYDSAEAIHKAAERAAAFTQELLAISQRQVLQLESTGLHEFLHDLKTALQGRFGEKVELKSRAEDKAARAMLDRARTMQAIINLVTFSCHAVEEIGKIVIEASDAATPGESPTTDPGSKPGPCIRLSIFIHGWELDESDRGHFFEPFYAPRQKGTGSGLSLAAVYGTVKQTGGDILVQSGCGSATTFEIYLPKERPME